jgi:hypothetical protein
MICIHLLSGTVYSLFGFPSNIPPQSPQELDLKVLYTLCSYFLVSPLTIMEFHSCVQWSPNLRDNPSSTAHCEKLRGIAECKKSRTTAESRGTAVATAESPVSVKWVRLTLKPGCLFCTDQRLDLMGRIAFSSTMAWALSCRVRLSINSTWKKMWGVILTIGL